MFGARGGLTQSDYAANSCFLVLEDEAHAKNGEGSGVRVPAYVIPLAPGWLTLGCQQIQFLCVRFNSKYQITISISIISYRHLSYIPLSILNVLLMHCWYHWDAQ